MTINVDNNSAFATHLFRRQNRYPSADSDHGFNPHMKGRGGVRINGGSGDDRIYVNDWPGPPGDLESRDPVAADEHGRIWNDPHFLGGDGGRFDIQGQAGKTYDLLSDRGLQFNGQFDVYNNYGTAVGATGLTVTGAGGRTSQVSFYSDGSAEIDGQAMEQGKSYALADGGTAELKGKSLTITTAEGYTIKQDAKSWGDRFINVDVSTGADGVDHGRMPGGLLGHTFDADNLARNGKTGRDAQGEGAIDGVVQDYETNGLFTRSTGNNGPGAIDVDGGSGDDRIVINGPVHGPVHVDGGSGDDEIVVNGPVDGPVDVDGGSGDDVIVIGPGQPGPIPLEPVAAEETGKIWGDPHFVGGDGGKYDVQGEAGKIYDLLSDRGLDFRGRYDGWSDGVTVVGETGLTVGSGLNSDNINFRKDGTARINDQLMVEGKTYDLADGGTARLENGQLTVTTAEGYTINQSAQGSGDRAYINIEVTTGKNGVDNGQMPGGLLGQTFDADNQARNGRTGKGAQGEGAIDGQVSDYERPALDPVNDNRGNRSEEGGDLLQKMEQMLEQLMEALEEFKRGQLSKHQMPKTETHTDAGSGDDEVDIRTGGRHTVDLGSGDDHAYVGFEDDSTGNSAIIHGGSGDDTVTLAGSRSDYTVRRHHGYSIYTDQSGNSIKIADDVEHIRFKNRHAA